MSKNILMDMYNDYLNSHSIDEIIKKCDFYKQNKPTEGPLYITPQGDFISVSDNCDVDFDDVIHADLWTKICDNTVYNEDYMDSKGIDMYSREVDDAIESVYEAGLAFDFVYPLEERLIRCNSGSTPAEDICYISIDDRCHPTSSQYIAIEDWLNVINDHGFSKNVLVYCGPKSVQYYFEQTFPEDIVKDIKARKSGSTGRFIQEKLLSAKRKKYKEADGKKKYIHDFMSSEEAMKEFPDIKQRFAVCMSYWEKRKED